MFTISGNKSVKEVKIGDIGKWNNSVGSAWQGLSVQIVGIPHCPSNYVTVKYLAVPSDTGLLIGYQFDCPITIIDFSEDKLDSLNAFESIVYNE